jgi:two-component system response regulator LytT
MLTIAVCDDRVSDIELLESLIQDYCRRVFYEINMMNFLSGEDLVECYIEDNIKFDIVFLDIYMGGDNGIITAKKIREYDSQCKIIFITTSLDHALDSFSVFPFNYLIKPITPKVFDPIFEKALLNIDKEKQKSITIKTKAKVHTIFYKDIKFLDSDGRKINMHTIQMDIDFYSKLDDIEAKINDERFLRCHKSFLVNIDYIASVGEFAFILLDNTEVPIKQRDFANIKKIYYTYVINKAALNKHL